MAALELELRVAALEAEMSQLKQRLDTETQLAKPWWQEIYGTFADDPLYEEAMRLGREYRESLHPNSAKRSTKRTAKSPAKQSAKQRKR